MLNKTNHYRGTASMLSQNQIEALLLHRALEMTTAKRSDLPTIDGQIQALLFVLTQTYHPIYHTLTEILDAAEIPYETDPAGCVDFTEDWLNDRGFIPADEFFLIRHAVYDVVFAGR